MCEIWSYLTYEFLTFDNKILLIFILESRWMFASFEAIPLWRFWNIRIARMKSTIQKQNSSDDNHPLCGCIKTPDCKIYSAALFSVQISWQRTRLHGWTSNEEMWHRFNHSVGKSRWPVVLFWLSGPPFLICVLSPQLSET